MPISPKLIRIVVLILALGIAGGVWYWGNIEKESDTGQAIGDDASWKKYRNEEYGFEVKYPSTWESPRGELLGSGLRIVFAQGLTFEPVRYYDNRTGGTLAVEDIISGIEKTHADSQRSKISIDGKTATKISYTIRKGLFGFSENLPVPATDQIVTEVYFPKGVFPWLIYYEADKGTYSPAFLEQILSTFKFIDKSQDEISDWKTYRNEKYGFEVKYPQKLEVFEEKPEPVNYHLMRVIFQSSSEYMFLSIATAESVKEYNKKCTACLPITTLKCEDVAAPCSEYYYAIQGGFWGKRGVIKNSAGERIEMFVYFKFDARTFSQNREMNDTILRNLAAQGKIDKANEEILDDFNSIFSSIKFIK